MTFGQETDRAYSNKNTSPERIRGSRSTSSINGNSTVVVPVVSLLYCLGMYRIAIFKIRPEPDNTGYQTNYPAGTGYLDTCCIIANFFVYFVVRIKCIIRCVCFQLCVLTHCIGLQLIYVKELVYMTH